MLNPLDISGEPFGDRIVYVDKTKKAVTIYVTASSFMWTS